MARGKAYQSANFGRFVNKDVGVSKSKADQAKILAALEQNPQTIEELRGLINGQSTAIVKGKSEEKPMGRSKFGRLMDDIESVNQREMQNSAQVFGAVAKMLTDAGQEVNISIPDMSTTPRPKQKLKDLIKRTEELDRAEAKNAGQILDVAAKLVKIREQQIEQGKGLAPSKQRKQLKAGKAK